MLRNRAAQFFLAVAALLVITFGASKFQAAVREDGLHLWFFDVGQGDSELFDTPDGHQVLIDGGPDNTVLSRLSHAMPLGDKEIDLVVVTHNHADHLSGINDVLDHYQVDKVWVSGAEYDSATFKKFQSLLAEKHVPTEDITAGKTFNVSGLSGIALYPLTSFVGQKPDNPHDANLVTDWQYGSTTALLMGDAEVSAEAAMLGRGIIKPADILKVGHHGSYTSSSPEFLKTVGPKLAVIEVGLNNKFGHPHQTTLDKLTALRIPVLRTDHDGSIECVVTASDYRCSPHS